MNAGPDGRTVLRAPAESLGTSTGALAHMIACETASLIELADELIGAGSEDANTLHGMRLVLSRIGWMADTVAHAHGGKTWANGDRAGGFAAVWMIHDPEACIAYAALAAPRASGAAAAVKGGAA